MLSFYQHSAVWYDVVNWRAPATYLVEQFIRKLVETHKKVPAAKNYYVFVYFFVAFIMPLPIHCRALCLRANRNPFAHVFAFIVVCVCVVTIFRADTITIKCHIFLASKFREIIKWMLCDMRVSLEWEYIKDKPPFFCHRKRKILSGFAVLFLLSCIKCF